MTRIEEIRARLEAATPGPWKLCGDDRGGCQCRFIWSTATDHPVAKAEEPEWGDHIPAIRLTDDGKAEAYLDKMSYGAFPAEEATANGFLIANAPTDVAYLLERLQRAEELISGFIVDNCRLCRDARAFLGEGQQ